MEQYSHLGPETIFQEFKEAVLSTPDTKAEIRMLTPLSQGVLSDEYFELIINQTLFDLYRYLPRYL